MSSRYVLIWREETATRLRTYTSADDRPLASPLDHIHPHPHKIINDADSLSVWLNSPPDERVVALRDDLARTELGWDPTSPSDEETSTNDAAKDTN